MPIINDDEFGKIVVRRSGRTKQLRLRVAPDGSLRASIPLYAPTLLLKRLITSSRPELRQMIEDAQPTMHYSNGQQIGKSHTLVVVQGTPLSVTRRKQHIIVTLPPSADLDDNIVMRKIREACIVALRLEAKSYLPKRIAYLANQLGYSFTSVRFSHASSRWGSCSTNGTISLNIALMKLPFEIIDYVLIHELSHTVQMNHSPLFWKLVEKGDPHFIEHRRQLKQSTPSI